MAEALRAYALLSRMWLRASLAYPLSLVVLVVINVVMCGLDVVAILVVFHWTTSLGGLPLAGVLLLYGTSTLSFGLTDLFFGTVERLGKHIRAGTFDVMLIRPAGTLTQLAAEEFAPRRVGRPLLGLIVLVHSLSTVDMQWTAGRVLILPLTVLSGVLLFAGIFLLGAAFQFVAGDAAEVTNSVTYGGATLTQYPLSIYGSDAVRALTYVVPLAFVNWYPALYLLGLPDPYGMPAALRYLGPAVAVLLCLLGALAWRAGVRSYRSTGS